MSLVDRSPYKVTVGGMTVQPVGADALIEIDDTVTVAAIVDGRSIVSFSGNGLLAKERITFAMFPCSGNRILIGGGPTANHGDFYLSIREALWTPNKTTISVLAFRHGGGDDSGGEWGGNN